jgi:hypothetical protein
MHRGCPNLIVQIIAADSRWRFAVGVIHLGLLAAFAIPLVVDTRCDNVRALYGARARANICVPERVISRFGQKSCERLKAVERPWYWQKI